MNSIAHPDGSVAWPYRPVHHTDQIEILAYNEDGSFLARQVGVCARGTENGIGVDWVAHEPKRYVRRLVLIQEDAREDV